MRLLMTGFLLGTVLATPTAGQTGLKSRLDSVDAQSVAAGLVEAGRSPGERRDAFRLARRLIRLDESKGVYLRGMLGSVVRSSDDPEVISRGVALLVEGAEQHDDWVPVVAGLLRTAVEQSPGMALLILDIAKNAPLEVRESLVEPATTLLLSAETEDDQKRFGQQLVLLGESGRMAFERTVASGAISSSVAAWVRFTTGGGQLDL